jgi:hypothetical protein
MPFGSVQCDILRSIFDMESLTNRADFVFLDITFLPDIQSRLIQDFNYSLEVLENP